MAQNPPPYSNPLSASLFQDEYPILKQSRPWSSGYRQQHSAPSVPQKGDLEPAEHVFHRFGEQDYAQPPKHRRSKYGCYTCRSRRIKCDESHPVCNRCQIARRECKYPEEALSAKKEGSGDRKHGKHPLNSPKQDSAKASSQSTEDPSQSATSVASVTSDAGSLSPDRLSPRPFSAKSQLTSPTSPSDIGSQGFWRASPEPEIEYFLEYVRTNLSNNHYVLAFDGCGFVSDFLVSHARSHDSLLYAVVAYAAYHNSLGQPGATIDDFIPYYSRSLSLLRMSLESNQWELVPTLLTILQLAQLEESLGDWVHLVRHQKAALRLIYDGFTPESIATDQYNVKILEWYLHFDLFAALLSGRSTYVDRVWVQAQYDYYAPSRAEQPLQNCTVEQNCKKLEERVAQLRLMVFDMVNMVERHTKLDEATRNAEIQDMDVRMNDFYAGIDPVLIDPDTDYLRYGEILSQYDASNTDIWMYAMLLLRYWGALLTFKLRFKEMRRWVALQLMAKPAPDDFVLLARRICYMFDAIEAHDPTPAAIVPAQTVLAIADAVLSREEGHLQWYRKKIAHIESLGQIFPMAYRQSMADKWKVSVNEWSLPDPDKYPPIIEATREYVQARNDVPIQQSEEDLRTMTRMFKSLNMFFPNARN